MIGAHPSEAELRQFTEGWSGGLSESEVIQIATHIDQCPLCSSRAQMTDPVSALFASAIGAQAVPEGLSAAILVAAQKHSPATQLGRGAVVGISTALLALSLLLVALFGGAGDLIVAGATAVGASIAIATTMASFTSVSATPALIAGVGIAASVATLRRQQTRRAA